jgi:hypothetical protein
MMFLLKKFSLLDRQGKPIIIRPACVTAFVFALVLELADRHG